MNKTHSRPYLGASFYATTGLPSSPPRCIPLSAYCAKYFLGRSQVLNSLREGRLCAVAFKKKLFVIDKEPV